MRKVHIADVPLSDLIAAEKYASNQLDMWNTIVYNYEKAPKTWEKELPEARENQAKFRDQKTAFKEKITEKYNWMVEAVL
jgi:hypothetical protein